MRRTRDAWAMGCSQERSREGSRRLHHDRLCARCQRHGRVLTRRAAHKDLVVTDRTHVSILGHQLVKLVQNSLRPIAVVVILDREDAHAPALTKGPCAQDLKLVAFHLAIAGVEPRHHDPRRTECWAQWCERGPSRLLTRSRASRCRGNSVVGWSAA